jgi:hypothetical protein
MQYGHWTKNQCTLNLFSYIPFCNVIFQHPVALCRSDLGVPVPSMRNGVRCSFIRHYFTTCFGLNGHLQVYRLSYFRTVPLNVMRCSFSCCYCRSLFLVMWVARDSFLFLRRSQSSNALYNPLNTHSIVMLATILKRMIQLSVYMNSVLTVWLTVVEQKYLSTHTAEMRYVRFFIYDWH